MSIKRTIYIFILGMALLSQGCSQVQSDLDKIELATLDGERINMNDFKGKIVFMNFWATWCKPCIQEMPTIAKAQEQLKGQDIVFLFPSEEDEDLIRAFKEKKDFDFNYVQARNISALNIQALPTTFIFNPNGERVFSEAGFRDWSTPENLALIRGN
ncbi:MAG: TlpA family protein disulfide reductase [Cyclobacteriaceae bacterium]|nr:TlpA family protein disulfide reductase [Cyclobacteriaceae bacterium]